MDPLRQKTTISAFDSLIGRSGARYPVTTAVLRALVDLPTTAAVFDRYFRIISAVHPQPALMLAALHHLALSGEASALARFLPTCGGRYAPEHAAALTKVVADTLAEHQETVLDFLLTHQPQSPEARRIAGVALGLAAASSILGGGVSLFELGSGLHLYPDQFRFAFGDVVLGDSGPEFGVHADSNAGLRTPLASGLPAIVHRQGLDIQGLELSDPANRAVQLSFVWPDQTDRADRLRAGHAILAANSPLPVRYGDLHFDLLPALGGAYDAMAPGNTFVLANVLTWSYLSDDERVAVTSAVQRLGQRLQPHKPMAWVQVEPALIGGELEIKLSTYGWADQEDRTVRILGRSPADFSSITWLE